MNILVTGGFGFVGHNLIPLLEKEGHKLFIIDTKSKGDVSLHGYFKAYQLDIHDERCEEIFANNTIDVVIHLAETFYLDDDLNQIQANHHLGLTKLLYLSEEYQVSKFIYLSSLEVFGKTNTRYINESSEKEPTSNRGMEKKRLEDLCLSWPDQHVLKTRVLRVGQIYGPWQAISDLKTLTSEVGFVDQEYIFVSDVVYAINSVINYSISKVINLSASGLTSGLGVDNKLAMSELYWKSKNSHAENMRSTLKWVEEQNLDRQSDKKNSFIKSILQLKAIKWLMPFIENFVTFLLFIILNQYMREKGVNSVVDLLLIYIIAMGIVYGLKQSSIASLLSIFYYIFSVKSIGETFLTATYNIESLLHISVYIFVGTVIGYMSDSKRVEIDENKRELKEINEKLSFVYDMYDESKRERHRLHDQILSSDDSFGKIYNIVARLEAVEPNKIYNSAVEVIEDVLNVQGVYIYFLTKNQYYLRLISKSKDATTDQLKSINIKDHSVVKQVIESREIFINKAMDQSLPMVMIPIGNADKIFSVIYIHKIAFEQLDAYKVNLIKVVSNLITTSIGRAYLYESATDDERYLENTSIMKSKYFMPLVIDKYENVQEHKNPITILLIKEYEDQTIESLNGYLENQLRDFDYIGMDDDRELYILLSNTTINEASYVISRFKSKGVLCELIEEEDIYGLFNRTSIH